jgi:uncharacterized phage protein gp47/JayE
MANINIKSYNEVLGDMIRKIIADTPVNDINKGSVLLTLLEAAAANDYENNVATLNTLELLNIDAIRNSDLDAFGSNLGLTRNTATKASGFIVVTDSNITKRSTSLYPIKPPPIAGTSVLHVNDASEWNQTGTLYIGRDEPSFEGPISYTSIVDNGSFYTINLASALENDHLISEAVVDGQGTTDRQVLAGTTVKIPANNINPEIEYTVLRDAVIPAGEDTSDEIAVTAVRAGSSGNAGINTITLFGTVPFTGAEVTNTNAFINGIDTESDDEFRDRIKAYSSTLARGTRRSILSAIDGVSDETDGKQVASAVITEPAEIGDPSIVYIDDGQGFEPSQAGQSVDLLVASASGNEEFLQLANYPLPRPQSVNTEESPYLFTSGMELKVLVDGVEESVVFNDDDFNNTSSATISEVVVAINDKAELFRCRLTENSTRLLLYPVDERAETIQVISDGGALDANTQLKFPTNEFSYIKLYKNNELLKEVERSASLTTTPFSTWGITVTGNLIISVDDTPDQDRSFDTSDFGGLTFNALELSDWVTAFNNKFAGITATATTTGRMVITSNKEGSESQLEIVGGSYLSQMFSGQETESVGQDSDFALNRQNGNLQIKTTIAEGDVITAGADDTKGDLISTEAIGGSYNVSTDANNRPAEMVIVADAERVLPRAVNLAIGATITLTDEGSNVMRIMASTASAFNTLQPGDFIYLTNRGHSAGTGAEAWVDLKSSGIFKITAKGEHLSDGVDTYVEVLNVDMVVGGPYTVEDGLDVQAFFSDKYPQLWKGTFTATPAAASIADVVDSINDNIKGVVASVFRTNFIKLTSVTEEDGSIAIPVSVGNASQLFATGSTQQEGTQSHIANRTSDKEFITIFSRTAPSNTNVWLDRYTYSDVKGSVTTAVEPSKDGSGTYSETLEDTSTVDFQADATYDDVVNITSGQNKRQLRDIRTIIDSDNLGTRHNTPRSLLDYNIGDEFQLAKNFEFSADDSLVAIMDEDSIAKTIDVSFSRTGQINSGSQAGVFLPTNLAFSADDADNEPGIDFGTLDVWGTLPTQRSTNFDDYAVWFRARNWYDSNSAVVILRAKEYGPIGDKIRFTIEHPTIPDASSTFSHVNIPDYTLATYTFGSGSAVTTNVAAADQFTVTDLGGNNFRYTFPGTATTSNANIGDVISIRSDSGFSAANQGAFRINGKNDVAGTVDVYNPNGAATVVGNPAVHTVQCVADVADSLDGTYFILNAPNGDTVKFWYDNNNSGTIEPAIGTTTRSYEINVATGASAITVATATAAVIIGDAAFSTATNGGGTLSLITVTNANNGPAAQGVDGGVPTGFTFALVTPGVSDTYETLTIPSALEIFPITDTDTATIVNAINAGEVLVATEHTTGDFIRATREEDGVAVNELAYDHDPDPLNGKNDFVSLHDSQSWVLTFQNANPNFQLKTSLDLVGVSAAYVMDTTPNDDGSTGEYFKLIPVTLTNTRHHLTHKALSQMDIVSDVSVAADIRNLQVKSELLGSQGAVEVVGGRANAASFKILGDSQVNTSNGVNYLEMKIPAAPNTFSPGQHVILENDAGVERLNRQISTDTMDVVKINDDTYEYRYNDKDTNFSQYVEFTIADANGIDPVSYPTAGLVWRWTHNDAGSSVNFVDVGTGVPAAAPQLQDAAGTIGAETNLFLTINDPGTVSTSLDFDITSSGQPAQADYITFENAGGSDYAVWFDIDGAGTAPTGASYVAATNKVEIDILSTDTPNQILSKLLSQLLIAGIAVDFTLSLSNGASLSDVREGNLVNAFGTLSGWDSSNQSFESGDAKVAGYPIVKVDDASMYFDVVNPDGAAMSATAIGAGGTVLISSTPIIEWRLAHSARVPITSIVVASNVATATTDGPHRLNVGDSFTGIDIPSAASPDTGIVASVLGENQFTYASTNPDTSIAPGGLLIKSGKTRTRYKIESLSYNNLFRLSRTNGDSPQFTSTGVAVDDMLVISGSTFQSVNSGEFRVLAVDEDSIIYENINAQEELDTFEPFNNIGTAVSWVANSNQITGVAGSFTNLSIGDWVKKTTDDDTLYVQVSAFNTGLASTATIVTLANNYGGITSTTLGHALDQNTDIGAGVYLQDTRDIRILEGDSVMIGDDIFITESTSTNWFETANSGTFNIDAVGTDATDGRVFLRVSNGAGIAETDVSQGVVNTKFSITESDDNKFTTIKQISHIVIDEFDSEKRIVYLTPGNRSYKWNQSNVTSISGIGKIGYSEDITTGVDGYLYYTGLLRKVQRIIDGFEPDPVNFPGRKAVGSLIEVLPPLPRRVTVAIDVTTQDGVNLSEISDEITSVIINYVSDLGVGEDVILSDIIVRVKNIDGVAAVTFITPDPSEERIAISSDEKAFIESSDISIA